MVYRLTKMKTRTKILFFIIIWLFSAFCAVLGSMFIATAIILPNTPYEITRNPVISEIRQQMGPLIFLGYWDQENGIYYPNITIADDGERVYALTDTGLRIENFRFWFVEEVRQNGSIVYFMGDPDATDNWGKLEFYSYLGVIWEIEAKPEHINVNFRTKEIGLKYRPGENYPIYKRIIDAPVGSEIPEKPEFIGDYFIVQTRGVLQWLSRIISDIYNNLLGEFLFIGRTLLTTVAIGGGIGILMAFFLIITKLAHIFGGQRWTFYLLKSLNGKLGKLVRFIPFFDFNGEFFVEERFVDIIDLSTVRSTFRELFKQRWYDMIFFPTALASILTIFFVQNYPGEDKIEALALSPLISPIVLILLLVYFPAIWAYNEGGFKRLEISPQGDIIAVKPLGKILRDGLGIVVGFSGIISLGALAVEVTQAIAKYPKSTGQIEVAGFTFDIFGLILLGFWTIGLFLLLLGSIIVGSSLLAANYLQSAHLETIENIRKRSEKEDLITNWGSVSYQFKPKAAETIYMKGDEQNQ
ncbi:MAG: hypothetical protein EAX86_05065 [Candidatus Heimdallarchaeota archaeon]|nr:hypothetical protein [Candidatus Heimdallarchaeota archaeon]